MMFQKIEISMNSTSNIKTDKHYHKTENLDQENRSVYKIFQLPAKGGSDLNTS